MRCAIPVGLESSRASPRMLVVACLCIGLSMAIPGAHAWSPGTSDPDATGGFTVDVFDRTDVLAFFHTIYGASNGYADRIVWTGSLVTGDPGTTADAFKADVLRRINFYRALAQVPTDVVFNPVKSDKCQDAALMFSANSALSHSPPNNWTFYTADGAEAAANSNIALGTYGPGAVDGFMVDPGANNNPVGHRRWLLNARALEMGTGDVPGGNGKPAANCIWVIGNFNPAPPPQFIAWPNAGYVPHPLVPARWSLAWNGANFSAATVKMTSWGVSIPVTIVSNADNGYAENTLVWEPYGLASDPGGAGVSYDVTVSGISGTGVPTSFSYTVTAFDPEVLGDEVVINGPDTAAITGQHYDFDPVDQADAYQLRVSRRGPDGWSEGAEDAPTPMVLDETASAYALRQSDVWRTGSKAFHLTLPSFQDGDQVFEVDRDLIPGPTGAVEFHDNFRFVTTACRLALEISTDGGHRWQEIWSRAGSFVNGSGVLDAAFNARSVSLAAYQGQSVRMRFALRRAQGGSAYLGTDMMLGVFVDDISVTGTETLSPPQVTALGAAATSFELSSATAGAALVEGDEYYLRIRPQVGTRWFGDGPFRKVTPQAPQIERVAALATVLGPNASGGIVLTAAVWHDSNQRFYAHQLDPATGAPLSVFQLTTAELLALTNLADMNANGAGEIAALERTPDGLIQARIKDGSTGEQLLKIRFDPDYEPLWLRTLIGGGNAGGNALAVLGVDATGWPRVQIRDAGSGALIRRVSFSTDYDARGFEVVEDINGNANAEFVLFGVNDLGRIRAQVRDSVSGKHLALVKFGQSMPTFHSVGLDMDADGTADALAIAGRNVFTAVRAETRTSAGTLIGTAQFNANYSPEGLVAIPDLDGSGAPELGLLQTGSGGTVQAQIKDAASGSPVGIIAFPGAGRPRALVTIPDLNGNGTAELALLSEEPSQSFRVQVRDAGTGALLNATQLP